MSPKKNEKNMADYIEYFMNESLKSAISDEYRKCIVSNLLDEVIDDIKETADKDFSDDDIRLAIGRVLMDRLDLWF